MAPVGSNRFVIAATRLFVVSFREAGALVLVLALTHVLSVTARGQTTARQLLELSTADPAKNYSEVSEAVAQFAAGNLDAARATLITANKKHPELPPGATLTAYLVLGGGRVAAVREELERAATEAPNDPEAFAMFGDLAFQDRRLTDAEVLFDRSLRLAEAMPANSPRKSRMSGRCYAGLAAIAEARQQWPKAEQQLAAWIKVDPSNGAPHQRLARALFRQNKPKDAYREFQLAAKQSEGGSTAAADLALAGLYAEAGDQSNAGKMMAAGIKRAPKDLMTRLAVTEWALNAGKLDEAKAHAAIALSIDPASLTAKILSGAISRLGKDASTAETILASAHLQSPDNFQATNLLALVLADQSEQAKRQRALELAQVNVVKYPQSTDAMVTLGFVCQQLGMNSEAEAVLNRALGTGNLNADGAYLVARMFERQGRDEDAAKLAAKALETKPPFLYRAEAAEIVARYKARVAKTSEARDNDPAPKE